VRLRGLGRAVRAGRIRMVTIKPWGLFENHRHLDDIVKGLVRVMTTKNGKGGVYRTSDQAQQTPGGERAAGAQRRRVRKRRGRRRRRTRVAWVLSVWEAVLSPLHAATLVRSYQPVDVASLIDATGHPQLARILRSCT